MNMSLFFLGGIALSAVFAFCGYKDDGFYLGLATLALTALVVAK